MGMDFAANRLQIQQKPAGKPKGRPRGRSFMKGLSGNPAGKRPGTRNRATIIAEELLDCETRPLLRQAIDASEFASQLARLETAAAPQAKDARELEDAREP